MSSTIHTTRAGSAAVKPLWFVGGTLAAITFSEPSYWRFTFSTGASVSVECLWRVLNTGAIIVTSEDHGQKFGLPHPIDAASRASGLLVGEAVAQFTLREDTLDLSFVFSNGHRLEVLPTSAGYEAWQIVSPQRQHVIAQGGGQLCTYAE